MFWILSLVIIVALIFILRKANYEHEDSMNESKKKVKSFGFDNQLIEARENASGANELNKLSASEKPKAPSVAKDGLYGMKGISSGDYLNGNNIKKPF